MDSSETPPPFAKRLQARLAASRFFTFSLLLHVVIVVMGGSVVLFKHVTDPPDFTAGGGDGLVSQDVQAQPPPPQEETQEQFAASAPPVNAPQISAIVSNSVTPSTFQLPTAVPVPHAPAVAVADKIEKLVQNVTGKGMGNVPGSMAGRFGGTRGTMMAKNGGKDKSEKAVLAGLRWLKEHQNQDGSWGGEFKGGMSGLALLCFLGHGEKPENPEFGPTVKKAVDWMIDKGTEFNGRMSLTKDGWGGNPGVYQQAMSAYAMGEYYSITQDDRIKDVLTKAVKLIIDGQNANGGWRYNYEKGGYSDTSVTGWQVQALKAAHLTGLNIPGVDDALDKSMNYFKLAQREDGGFGYHDKAEGNGYSLTGVGTLCVYFWKQDKDKLVHEGIKHIIEQSKKDFPVKYKGEKADLYAWYYDTQACLMFGGEPWVRWNQWFQDELCDAQNKGEDYKGESGAWPPTEPKEKPAGGELQMKPDGDGPYYRTSLCVLMLEVYYRYMPTNKS